jgi:putative ABC transport system permease protein
MTTVLPPTKYSTPESQLSFYDQLKERLKSLPGVAGAGAVDILPLQPGNTTRFYVDGDPIPPPDQLIEANMRFVDDTYFQTLGVPVTAGRPFDTRDDIKSPGVVILGKTVADRIFAGRDPIGRRIKYGSTEGRGDLIVGVVGDVKIAGIDEAFRPVLYYPFRQNPSVGMNLVVRTSTEPTSVANTVRNEVRSMEPAVAIFAVQSMEQLISSSPAAFMRRFPGLLISVFAGVALLLASIGIYGVVSYSVSQQSHYIGVRMALGAQTSDILRMVLKQGLLLALAGVVIGTVAAVLLMQLLTSLLFEVKATDPTIFVLGVITLFAVAVLACYVPARRATKVDPLEALRYE